MDQLKIGRFIAERRKELKLTQFQLAEKLNITDRAVSKWERGKSLPDAAIMLELCEILEITVNDLLSGEVIVLDKHNKETEKLLLEMIKEKEKSDKRMLQFEIVIGMLSLVILLTFCAFASYGKMEEGTKIALVFIGLIISCIGFMFSIKIEQIAGYYKCRKCGHKYVPSFKAINLAPHIGRTRYMKCPECGQKSWQKKVISKD